MKCCGENKCPDYTKELVRLKKVAGQLDGIAKMIEERRYCPDIIIQITAASSALKSLKSVLLKSHIEHCVYEAFKSKDQSAIDQKVAELMHIYNQNID